MMCESKEIVERYHGEAEDGRVGFEMIEHHVRRKLDDEWMDGQSHRRLQVDGWMALVSQFDRLLSQQAAERQSK
jgi:hypothetical protein